MHVSRYRVFIWASLLVLVNWMTLALLDPDPPGQSTARLGYFLGSLFAHATLAAAWTAYGPLPLLWRLPLSLAWIGSLFIAVSINIGLNGGPTGAVYVVGGCLLGQWVLLQIPLWALVLGMRLRLRHVDHDLEHRDSGQRQFSIRQLLVITAITAVVLSIGRVFVDNIPVGRETPIFIFLAVAAIVTTLPLLLAALMKRMAVAGVLSALVLIGVVTAWELPLLRTLTGSRGPQTSDFIAINASSAAVILIIAGTIRLGGYCLYVGGPSRTAPGNGDVG